jgi:hypothetical protein
MAEGIEHKVILQRVGKFHMKPKNLFICQLHRDILGSKFLKKRTVQQCKAPGHEGGTRLKSSQKTRQVSLELSQKLLILEGTHIIPFNSFLCSLCYNKFIVKTAAIEVDDEMDSEEEDSQDHEMGDFDSPDLFACSSEPSQSQKHDVSFRVQSQEQLGDRRQALNAFLKTCNSKVMCHFSSSKPFDELHRSNQHKMMGVLANTIASVMKTLSSRPENDAKMWLSLVDSERLMANTLRSTLSPGSLIEECISAWNSVDHSNIRRQILTLLVTKYTFTQLQKYNNKDYLALNPVSREDDDEEDENVTMLENNLVWEPALTRYAYEEAAKHYSASGYAMKPVISAPKFIWKFDHAMISMIISLLSSDEVIQGMAYGTFSIKDEFGQQKTMAKVVRTIQKSELIKMIPEYLRQHGFTKIPSESTLYRFLAVMPAASTKEMRGVNNM